jgi:NADPH-dependent curcumin reductase CurA
MVRHTREWHDGLENVPHAIKLFEGSNVGKLMVKVSME